MDEKGEAFSCGGHRQIGETTIMRTTCAVFSITAELLNFQDTSTQTGKLINEYLKSAN